ncbi:MAG TPA: hypothetical protein CFH84_07120 [Sulfurimonas sp. UBA12504]|nr:MAG: hypothetical protein A2019_02490 [Sulfurimonas sp. GWF2_37_8]DAB29883.1 MAG TPA: hypothetical protein CFH84_07120 [Sulfurimonas sp. UBA12504]
MNLETIQNKTILLFGKSRAFSSVEFDAQMRYHKIKVVKENSEDVVLIVEGKMMTPYEQNASDALYESKKIKSVSIYELDRALAQHIDADALLMSLKLSHDKERLLAFIKNFMISDTLFFRLLKMYEWGGEDFFENDENRDVTAALIGRFYEKIERNHNVQYVTLGLMHLITQCKNAELIEAIALLEPLQKYLSHHAENANRAIIKSIAKHPITPKSVLKMFIQKADIQIKILIALREDCDVLIQKQLFESGEKILCEALSLNANLDRDIAKALMKEERHAKNMAHAIKLDSDLFEIFLDGQSVELATNSSLMPQMQEKLFVLQDEAVNAALAANKVLDEQMFRELFSLENETIASTLYANAATPQIFLREAYLNAVYHLSLAKNPNTPSDILLLLGTSTDARILEALAKNESTPVALLYQLQLDSRFERFVKENAAFGAHIQTQNMGWIV